MKDNKKVAEDTIVDFIDDEQYYESRRNKQKIENATWAIYIFATISFIFYLFYLLLHNEAFNWLNFALNILIIAIYFFLGVYSNQKPFTAFVALFCVMGSIFLLEIFLTEELNLRGIVIKIVLVVYVAMRLEAAKKVQEYENKNAVKK